MLKRKTEKAASLGLTIDEYDNRKKVQHYSNLPPLHSFKKKKKLCCE
jgi:hypothetical protein